MKLYKVLFHVVAIWSIAGSTLGDEDGGCPIAEGNEAKKLKDMLKDGFDECFGEVGGVDLDVLKNEMEPGAMSTTILVEFCGREDSIKNCISSLTTRYSACLNGTQPNRFVLLEDFLKSTFSFGCFENGEHLAIVINKMFGKDNTTAERNDFADCLAVAKDTIEVDGDSMIGFYHQFNIFKGCFINRMRGLNVAVYGAEIMLNGLSRNVKCPHSDDGSVVPCWKIATSSATEEKECPYEGLHEDDPPRFEIFFNYGGRCTFVNLNRLNPDRLRSFRTIEDYRTFFRIYCENRPHILDCVGDVSSDSKLCQNETDHRLFTLVADFVGSSLEIGCEDDGRNLATVFNGILNHAQQATTNETMKLCIEASIDEHRTGLRRNETMSSRTLLVYTVVDNLKKCILDGSTDVNSFKTVFASLMEEILGAAKCIHPENGIDVPCETLLKTNPLDL